MCNALAMAFCPAAAAWDAASCAYRGGGSGTAAWDAASGGLGRGLGSGRNTAVFQERNLKKNILKSVTTDLGKNAEHRRFQERKLFNKKTYSTKKAKYNRISGTKSKKKHLKKSLKKVS